MNMDQISKKELLLFLIIPALGVNAMVTSFKHHNSDTSFAQSLEQTIGVPNETHPTGALVNAFDELGLFHPVVGTVIGLLTIILYTFVAFSYYEQQKREKSDITND